MAENKKDKDVFNIPKEEFSEWYIELVRRAKLIDQRSPVKGFDVIMPNAYAIWEEIQDALSKEFKSVGARNAYFPLVIPESLLEKESDHFEGFTPEVAWITHGGDTRLDNRLAVRPTSETIINYMLSLWIRSYQDLPMSVNQWCNIVRWETKATKPFIRGREFLWQEGHTAVASEEEASENVDDILNIYKKVLDETLRIPCMFIKRPEWDKFAGAVDTISLETLMPDGRVLQAGTVHNMGQNFSKPFEIDYLDEENKKNFVHQTTWGVSTRLIGALVMVHGDDKGLVLPWNLAPVKVVIIPILFNGKEKPVLEKCLKAAMMLEKAGISAIVDDSDGRPGMKHYRWELEGVPVRMEIGPRDVEAKKAVLVRRDTGEKKVIDEKAIAEEVAAAGEGLDASLIKNAKKLMKDRIKTATSMDEIKGALEEGDIVRVPFCSVGSDGESCANKLKDETTAEVRGTLYPKAENPNAMGTKTGKPNKTKCPVCGKEARELVYIAKSY